MFLPNINLKQIRWRRPSIIELQDEFHEGDIQDLLLGHVSPMGYNDSTSKEAFRTFVSLLYVDKIKERKISNQNAFRFRFASYYQMRSQVTRYGGPKDPDSLVRAIQGGHPIPMPVFIKLCSGEYLLAGGATRTSIALLAKQKIQACVIDQRDVFELIYQNFENKLKKEYPKHLIQRGKSLIKKEPKFLSSIYKEREFEAFFPELDPFDAFNLLMQLKHQSEYMC